MGAQLVTQALARWAPHISDRAFRVLVRMAVTALDNDNDDQAAGMYFGGHELLAMTLRPGARGGTNPESMHRIVRYAVAELISVGAIECVEKPRKGKRGVYRLTLDSGTSIPPKRNNYSGIEADSGITTTDSGTPRSPLGTTGTTTRQERVEEEGVALPTEVPTPRAETEPTPINPQQEANERGSADKPRAADCGDCGAYLDPDGSCFLCSPRDRQATGRD